MKAKESQKPVPAEGASTDASYKELTKYLRANLLLMIQQSSFEAEGPKPKWESLLSKAGFSVLEIADLLDKKPKTVTMALYRSKPKNNSQDTSPESTES